MGNFDFAFEYTLKNEGGWSNHAKHRGGATNFGVSLRFARATNNLKLFDLDGDGDIDANDIKILTPEQAKVVYKNYFWNPMWDELSKQLSAKLFDMSVLMGQKQAIKLLQRALIMVGSAVVVDGDYGPKTHAAVLKEQKFAPFSLVKAIKDEQIKFYEKIVERDPSQAVFLQGWKNRAMK